MVLMVSSMIATEVDGRILPPLLEFVTAHEIVLQQPKVAAHCNALALMGGVLEVISHLRNIDTAYQPYKLSSSSILITSLRSCCLCLDLCNVAPLRNCVLEFCIGSSYTASCASSFLILRPASERSSSSDGSQFSAVR